MSTSEQLPRPPQVTLVGWMIIIGSVLVVTSAVETIGSVRSLESRELLEEYLTEGPGRSLGWSVETGMQAMRIAALVTAGCAAAAVVLGWFVLRRHHGARIAMTVLALPLFFSGVVTGGFVSSMVAAAAVLLWMQPARDWFDGKRMTPPRRRDLGDADPWARPDGPQHGRSADGAPAAPEVSGEVVPPGDGGPRAVRGFGERPVTPGREPGQEHAPNEPADAYVGPWAGTYAPTPVTRRPQGVLLAAVLTFAFAGLSFVSALASLAFLAFDPDALLDQLGPQREEMAAQGVTDQMLLGTTAFTGVVILLVSTVALVAAVLLLRHRPLGRALLLVTAGVSAGFCLMGAFVSPLLALPGLASVAVLGLLVRPDVRAWFAARR